MNKKPEGLPVEWLGKHLPPGRYTVQMGADWPNETASVYSQDGQLMNTEYPHGCSLLSSSLSRLAIPVQSLEKIQSASCKSTPESGVTEISFPTLHSISISVQKSSLVISVDMGLLKDFTIITDSATRVTLTPEKSLRLER